MGKLADPQAAVAGEGIAVDAKDIVRKYDVFKRIVVDLINCRAISVGICRTVIPRDSVLGTNRLLGNAPILRKVAESVTSVSRQSKNAFSPISLRLSGKLIIPSGQF